MFHTASITSITFHNDENGYSVLRTDTGTTVIGFFPTITEGLEYEFTGEFIENAKYGKQFKATSYKQLPPTSPRKIEQFIGGGLIEGIGPATAKNIVEKFGTRTLQVLEFNPIELSKMVRKERREGRGENLKASNPVYYSLKPYDADFIGANNKDAKDDLNPFCDPISVPSKDDPTKAEYFTLVLLTSTSELNSAYYTEAANISKRIKQFYTGAFFEYNYKSKIGGAHKNVSGVADLYSIDGQQPGDNGPSIGDPTLLDVWAKVPGKLGSFGGGDSKLVGARGDFFRTNMPRKNFLNIPADRVIHRDTTVDEFGIHIWEFKVPEEIMDM